MGAACRAGITCPVDIPISLKSRYIESDYTISSGNRPIFGKTAWKKRNMSYHPEQIRESFIEKTFAKPALTA
ncbi:MAG: hypothetical protein ACUVRX_06115 [Actinomycetota bacterium]